SNQRTPLAQAQTDSQHINEYQHRMRINIWAVHVSSRCQCHGDPKQAGYQHASPVILLYQEVKEERCEASQKYHEQPDGHQAWVVQVLHRIRYAEEHTHDTEDDRACAYHVRS